jgi:hypothetical protein
MQPGPTKAQRADNTADNSADNTVAPTAKKAMEPTKLRRALPLPTRGSSERMQCGAFELVLEGVRGGHILVVHDGSEGRRVHLGLRADAGLELRLLPTCYPCFVSPKEVIRLLPGTRVRGYLLVPLVPTLVSVGGDGQVDTLVELLSPSLAAEWRDGVGCVQTTAAPLLHRLPPPSDEPVAAVPLALRNRSGSVVAPAEIAIALDAGELRTARGHVFAAARRLTYTDDGVAMHVRSRRPAVPA